MKIKNLKTILIILICLVEINKGQTIDSSYQVATWQGFRSGAVTFTFDDNTPNQISVALPMFDQYGFKMTFYPVINWSPNWTALKAAALNGHEVGSHTVSHTKLSTLTDEQQTEEYKNSQDAINSKIPGKQCLTIAYPNCAVGNASICSQYYIAARICSGAIVSKSPRDFMNISSIVCGSLGSIQRTSDFTNKADAAASSNGWVVFLIHAIDNEPGYSPTSSTELKGALEYLYQNKNKFWVTSFSKTVRYIKERNSVSVQEVSVTDSEITAAVTDTMNNSIYNIPLTIRRLLPEGWTSVKITQNSKSLDSEIIDVNTKKYIQFDVVPDSSEVKITKEEVADVSGKMGALTPEPYLMQNYPNPFNPVTTIDYFIPENNYVTLKVYDVLGREVTTLVNDQLSRGIYSAKFNGSSYDSGIYFYTLYTGNYSKTKKLLLIK